MAMKAAKRRSASSDGDASDGGSKADTLNSSAILDKPVLFEGVSVRTCKLCGAKSNEDSPLCTSMDTEMSNGYRPWLNYRRHPQRSDCKYPYGIRYAASAGMCFANQVHSFFFRETCPCHVVMFEIKCFLYQMV